MKRLDQVQPEEKGSDVLHLCGIVLATRSVAGLDKKTTEYCHEGYELYLWLASKHTTRQTTKTNLSTKGMIQPLCFIAITGEVHDKDSTLRRCGHHVLH